MADHAEHCHLHRLLDDLRLQLAALALGGDNLHGDVKAVQQAAVDLREAAGADQLQHLQAAQVLVPAGEAWRGSSEFPAAVAAATLLTSKTGHACRLWPHAGQLLYSHRAQGTGV